MAQAFILNLFFSGRLIFGAHVNEKMQPVFNSPLAKGRGGGVDANPPKGCFHFLPSIGQAFVLNFFSAVGSDINEKVFRFELPSWP